MSRALTIGFFDHYELIMTLAKACEVLPQGWVAAAQAAAAGPPPTHSPFAQMALRHVGWQRGRLRVSAAQLTVRTSTAQQINHERRRQRHAEFAQLAAELSQQPAPRAADATDNVAKLLPELWSVRCRNNTKEVFWRLATNALPTADRMPAAAACICNTANPPPCTRAHIFSQCPMAPAMVAARQSELQAWSQHQQQQPAAAAAAGTCTFSCGRMTSGWRARSRGCLAVAGGWSASVWYMLVILCAVRRLLASSPLVSGPLAMWALVGGRWQCFELSCIILASRAWPRRSGGSVRRRGLLSGCVECQTLGLLSGWRAAACEFWRRWFVCVFEAAVTSQRLRIGLELTAVHG
jgi:hypothetical protein